MPHATHGQECQPPCQPVQVLQVAEGGDPLGSLFGAFGGGGAAPSVCKHGVRMH